MAMPMFSRLGSTSRHVVRGATILRSNFQRAVPRPARTMLTTRGGMITVSGLAVACAVFLTSPVTKVAECRQPGGPPVTVDHDDANTVTTPTGLKFVEVACGLGNEAKASDVVQVHYSGWLANGRLFDSSEVRGKPIEFQLGASQVIKGWDEGLMGMKEGGHRYLIIPPHLGYGARGAGGVIPANATLIFEVKLVKIGSSGSWWEFWK